jgi:hypothetical protein
MAIGTAQATAASQVLIGDLLFFCMIEKKG